MLIALLFAFTACKDGAGAPDTDTVGLYVSGTSLIIKSGTPVYEAPNNGTVAEASPYSGAAKTLEFEVSYILSASSTLPTNGILGTVTITLPSNSDLELASDKFNWVPGDAIEAEADVRIGTLAVRSSGGTGYLNLCTAETVFQDGDLVEGEGYAIMYSTGDVTIQLPRTEIEPGMYAEADMHLKEGWNFIAASASVDTETFVSKNIPSTARWVWRNH